VDVASINEIAISAEGKMDHFGMTDLTELKLTIPSSGRGKS
jgi:hypothetical protein